MDWSGFVGQVRLLEKVGVVPVFVWVEELAEARWWDAELVEML